MIKINDKTKCCGCYACYSICPRNAITMNEDEKGFRYPKINKEKCIECGLCTKVCPNLNNKKIENKPVAYSCINKNEKIRKQSSSGGIFTLISEEILKKNGIVFGATFDNKYNVVHEYIEKKDDLKKLRGSKYVQSIIDNTYKKAKEFLDNDRYVLFTGTPCQIEGLKRYLQKDYDKLYTQDIICHGVPSPKVWRKYLEYRKSKDLKDPIHINFRQKDNGWHLYSMLISYNDYEYKINHTEDLFMKAFLRNTSLRDSCYSCNFKKKNRISDITLGDFWGIENVLPKMNDDKGTSLVVVNSNKGKELFELIKNDIDFKKINLEDALQYNKSMIESVEMDKNRENFFKNLDKMQFNSLVKKYTYNRGIIRRIFSKIKRILKKLIR